MLPFRIAWADLYPGAALERRGEGGSVWSADGVDTFVLVIDEGVMADYIDPIADSDLLAALVRVHHFGSSEARERFLERRYPQGRDRA